MAPTKPFFEICTSTADFPYRNPLLNLPSEPNILCVLHTQNSEFYVYQLHHILQIYLYCFTASNTFHTDTVKR